LESDFRLVDPAFWIVSRDILRAQNCEKKVNDDDDGGGGNCPPICSARSLPSIPIASFEMGIQKTRQRYYHPRGGCKILYESGLSKLCWAKMQTLEYYCAVPDDTSRHRLS